MIKVLLVIPAHGQNIFLPKMLDRLSKLSVYPTECRYVIDRPQPGEYEEALEIYAKANRIAGGNLGFVKILKSDGYPEWVGHPQMNAGSDYFLTGYVRNAQVEYAIKNDFHYVIFIDGDCVPEPHLISAHVDTLSEKCSPIATVGRRREIIWNMEDQRMASPKSVCHLFADTPRLIDNEFWFVDSGVVWTCNFGLNMHAIKQLCSMNASLYGREEVFSSEFTGTWGGEDGFLGLECFYSGIPVYALPNGENGIIHQPHVRPMNKYDHPQFIPYLEAMREDLMARMHLHGWLSKEFVPRLRMMK